MVVIFINHRTVGKENEQFSPTIDESMLTDDYCVPNVPNPDIPEEAPRRSQRQVKKKTFDDYITFFNGAHIDCAINDEVQDISNLPRTVAEALSRSDGY
ncbi:hypothetical protein WA026_021885 [Henosepilachna vigintioctopunctata]|uniref:Uncharacterized protein n=1 Tax=Henosepilachna vigintioctopunctata TaxID=420089 RepID=A0AAW1UMX1_9CUCU